MPHALGDRPLLDRLNARIKHGGRAENGTSLTARLLTDTDIALHQQSVEMINEHALHALEFAKEYAVRRMKGDDS